MGSDDYLYPKDRVCNNQPIRQDYLDEIVWERILHILEDPELIRTEIEQRVQEVKEASPTKRRKEVLLKEKTRIEKSIDKLLDAYQEDLLPLSELRRRIPALRKRQAALVSEFKNLEITAMERGKIFQLIESIEDFISHMRKSAQTLNIIDRQKIIRLLVKEILVGPDTINIKHSIPTGGAFSSSEVPSYLLCRWRNYSTLRCAPERGIPFTVFDVSCLQPLPENFTVHGDALLHPLLRDIIITTHDITLKDPCCRIWLR